MRTYWRLITDPHGEPGARNMALDEAILQRVAEKKLPPTLRLYAWEPPTISLGFAQPSKDVDIQRLKSAGWGLVRRPTGGRAILHTDELTYSVTAPLDDPLLSGSLLESYRKISEALLAALSFLNINAVGDKVYKNGESARSVDPVCFEAPSNYEITAEGKKLIGSAQARKYGGILQHGAIPIRGEITRITSVLTYTSKQQRTMAAQRLSAHATTLEYLLGNAPSFQLVAEALIKGFSDTFAISFNESSVSSDELDLAADLVKNKYDSNLWTFRI